jgi:hypothetical protein
MDVGGKAIIFAIYKHDVFPTKTNFFRSVKLQETRWTVVKGSGRLYFWCYEYKTKTENKRLYTTET